ncbi:MAG: flagellar biosynthetic protein FliO [Lachnospiraceae bacterium]|nr:flagellar biosynthetic protein FliO [Lachnospiraceae bacterium]
MILNIIDICSNILSDLKFVKVSSVVLASKEVDTTPSNIPSSGESLLQLLGLLVLFIIILVACYFVTKWVASVSQGAANASNIRIIETHKITPNKYIQIVKIAEEYIAIAVAKDNVTFLCKLDEDNINLMPVKPMELKNFKDVFAKVKKDKIDDGEKNEEEASGKEDNQQNTGDME